MKSLTRRMLPRRLVRSYREMSYQPFVPGGWYFYSSADQIARDAEVARGLVLAAADKYDRGPGADDKSGLSQFERDQTPRFYCNWRMKGLVPFNYSEADLTCVNSQQAEWLRAGMKRAAERILPHVGKVCSELVPSTITYPMSRSKGTPFFAAGTNKKAMPAYASLCVDARSIDIVETRVRKYGMPLLLENNTLSRIQSSKAAALWWNVDEDGVPTTQYMTPFIATKNRRVSGVSAGLNIPSTRLAKVTSLAMQATGIYLPPISTGLDMYREDGGDAVCVDFSTFDETISKETISLIQQYILEPLVSNPQYKKMIGSWERTLCLDIFEYMQTNPTVFPPLRHDEAGRILNRAGMNVSGYRLTSVIATAVAAAYVETMLAETGVQARYVSFGDDIAVFATGKSNQKVREFLADPREEMGFKVKVGPDHTYLMTNLQHGCAYVSRMIMSTMQKEYPNEPRNLWVAAMGIAARRARLENHPFGYVYDEFCRHSISDRIRSAYTLATELGLQGIADKVASATLVATGHTVDSDEEIAEELGRLAELGIVKPGTPAWELATRMVTQNQQPVSEIYELGRTFEKSELQRAFVRQFRSKT